MLKEHIFYLLPYELRRYIFHVFRRSEFEAWQDKRNRKTASGRSLKPFDDHQCIFVHIPKSAGVSVSKTLFGNLGGGHFTIKQYQLIFPKKEFAAYFKFAFVRNPWDRIYSAYNFLKRGGMDAEDKEWAATNLADLDSFDEFINRILAKPDILKFNHFRPQYDFLCVPFRKDPVIDYLGFYENIEQDFEHIKNKLGLALGTKLRHDNRSLPDEELQKIGYKNAYTKKSRRIVSELYKMDIKFFGYNFDNSYLENQIKNRLSQKVKY